MRSSLIASMPKIACGILIIVSGWQLVSFWKLLSTKRASAQHALAIEPSRTASDNRQTDGGAAIAAAHLFGKMDEAPSNTTQELSESALALRGVVAMDSAQSGFAIIGTGPQTDHLYAIGDLIPGNYRLVNVFAEYVVLDRGGILRSLRLPRTTLSFGGGALLPQSLAQLIGNEPDSESVEEETPQVHPVKAVVPFIEKPVEWRDHD